MNASKFLMGGPFNLFPVTGQELEECGGIIDEFHPRASRTLFVGNLDKTVGYSDIQNIFVRFGEIVVCWQFRFCVCDLLAA